MNFSVQLKFDSTTDGEVNNCDNDGNDDDVDDDDDGLQQIKITVK